MRGWLRSHGDGVNSGSNGGRSRRPAVTVRGRELIPVSEEGTRPVYLLLAHDIWYLIPAQGSGYEILHFLDGWLRMSPSLEGAVAYVNAFEQI